MFKLDEMYFAVESYLSKINFDKLWKGFKLLKFALYNNDECFFDGKYIEKNENFLGNTSINYNGEMIAIWNVMEDISPIILCSKIIHEMFHGFQYMNNEKRFPDEMQAIYNYKYLDENLSIKLIENNLIVELIESFDVLKFQDLLALRKYRATKYAFEYSYETKIEQIEGVANFIELEVLKQISVNEYLKKINDMKTAILKKDKLFPIRIISYDIGALILTVLKDNNISFNEEFNNKTFLDSLVLDSELELILNPLMNLQKELELFRIKKEEIINRTLLKNDVVFSGKANLLGFNVYNALYLADFIISYFFVMYGDNENPKIEYGNFVIMTLEEGIINKIYRI
jgi:hypothetical protein